MIAMMIATIRRYTALFLFDIYAATRRRCHADIYACLPVFDTAAFRRVTLYRVRCFAPCFTMLPPCLFAAAVRRCASAVPFDDAATE